MVMQPKLIEAAKDLSLQGGMIVITYKETNQHEFHDLAVFHLWFVGWGAMVLVG